MGEDFSLATAFFYCLSLATTVGYEGGVPRTPIGKLVSVGIACIGLPIFLLYICLVGGALARRLQAVYSKCCCPCSGGGTAQQTPTSPTTSSRHVPLDYSRLVAAHHWKRETRPVPAWFCLLLLLTYLALGSIAVASYHSVSPVDAFHYCFSLLATIGVTRLKLGSGKEEKEDVVWVLLTSVYILLGVALVSMCLHFLQSSISSLVTSLGPVSPSTRLPPS